MRARFVALALSLCAWPATAAAIPYVPPPRPVYEAPIERALENVAHMQGIEEAQRERLLGRLNLLAYARDDANFTYLREGDELNLSGAMACNEVISSMRGPAPDGKQEFAATDMCARADFNLGPYDEVPNVAPEAPSARARARLEAAETHYARAIAIDARDLRARLGHAYVLDRLTRMDAARAELRSLIKLGLPQLSGETSEWETHAVLSEAAEHLAHVAQSSRDRARVTRLRARLAASRPMIYVTPVVVPLTDAPFARLIDAQSPVAFDLAGTGDTRAQGWLTPDAAWLVWDPEWRGDIRSGFDLIGQRSWAVFWSDGFEALRALDDNRDGELTGAELGGLALWRDANSNGVSDDGEVLPVNVHGIAALATRANAARPGLLIAPAGIRFEDGRTRPLYDWTPGQQNPAIS